MSKKPFMVCEIDPAELAVRMCEANYGIIRPTPDAKQALASMDKHVAEAWLRSAKAAADYIIEVVNAGARTQ